MKSKRVPDRVHVVHPPENDGFAGRGDTRPDGRSIEIVRMLAQISDKLKRSEAERYELLNELREYRKSLRELEDKADNSEKAYLAIENKLQTRGNVDTESLQRQAKFEKALKATEDKMVKAIAGQALIDKRLRDSEDKQTVIDQRLDESVTEQTRIGRQLEVASQDKSRMLRKVERLEEIVGETQDTLRAKAMVLLTDQSNAAQGGLAAPAWGPNSPQAINNNTQNNKAWWQHVVSLQGVTMTSMIVAALLGGWMINQVQQPQIPQIAVLDNGSLARLNLEENTWEPVLQDQELISPAAPTIAVTPEPVERTKLVEEETQPIENVIESTPEPAPVTFTPDEVSITADPVPENVLDYSDDQLLAALNNDPAELAGQLNEIAPSATPPQTVTEDSQNENMVVANIVDPNITQPMKNFEKLAFVQNPKIEKAVLAERETTPLTSRISADGTLPADVKAIETQAFAGVAEAQHDLAAIYTAGHGGVDQDFEKAAFWFREAADNNIANARYNLGVLYHQGLGQDRDLGRALYWYRDAAKLDHAEAQYNLGIAHIEGIGTNYDPRLAAAFFERAANNGIMEAAYNLGLIYENGLLGEAKPDEALLWYKIAADQGSNDARAAMAQLAKNLQIGMNDVDNLVARMQQINQSVKGRRAGPQTQDTQSAISTLSLANSQAAIVAQVQEYLMLTGAYSGPADGIIGPQTQRAIRAYQAANDLVVNGEINSALLNSMVGGATQKLQ